MLGFRPQETPRRHDIEDVPLARAGTDTIRVESMAVKCENVRETDATDKIVFASGLAKNYRVRGVVILCSSTSLTVAYARQCQSSSVMFDKAALRGPYETECRKTLVMHAVFNLWVPSSAAAFKRAQPAQMTAGSQRWSWTSLPATWGVHLIGPFMPPWRDHRVGSRVTSTSTTLSRILKLRHFNYFRCWRIFGSCPA